MLLALALLLYVAVALLNYSLVQSYLGAAAGNYFSKEWGGTVRIGSLHAMPFDHLILDDILLVSPTNDTIFKGETLRVGFRRFPLRDHGLELDHVYMRNAYYHLETGGEQKINLQYIIDYFKPKKEKEDDDGPKRPFTVTARTLELENVHYKMDLPDNRQTVYPYGVQIPHMEYLDIHAKFKNIKVVNDDITCRIVHLRTRERSGFEVKELCGQVHVSRYEIVAKDFFVRTARSTIAFDGELHYDTWKGMKGYLSTVDHKAEIKEGSHVAMSDVAYWAPVLWGVEVEAEACGTASGTIDSMVADMDVRWGRQSEGRLAGTIVGLPRVDTTTFDLEIERLRTDSDDLRALLSFVKLKERLWRQVAPLGTVDVVGSVHGGYRDGGTVNLQVSSAPGTVSMDAAMRKTPQGRAVTVEAGSEGLGLALLGSDWLTRSGFEISAEGELKDPTAGRRGLLDRLTLRLDGNLTNSVVKGRHIGSATVSGDVQEGLLTAQIASGDSLADLEVTAMADLRDSVNRYVAKLDIGNLDVGLLPHPAGMRLAVTGSGNDLETLTGSVEASQVRYGERLLGDATVNLVSNGERKSLQLLSDMAEATVAGHFRYEDLGLMARHFGQQYLPEIFNKMEALDSVELARLSDSYATFHVYWKDDGRRLRGLTDAVSIAKGSRVDGSYNYGEQLKMVVRSDSLRLGPVLLENVGASGRTLGDSYTLEVEAQSLSLGRIELLRRVEATLGCAPSLSTMALKWGSESDATRGDMVLGLEGNNVMVMKPWFYVGDSQWELGADRMAIENEGRLKIVADGLSLANQDQRIAGRVSLRGEDNDCVELTFDRFSLNLLSDVLLQDSPLDVEGDINGRFTMYGLDKTPYFNANLRIDSCLVNRQPLGSMDLRSNWNAELNIVNLEVANRQVRALGWMGLGEGNDEMNFNIDFHGLELKLAEPLLASFSSHIDGRLDGSFDVHGTLKKPDVTGEAHVEGGELTVDLTQVTYHFSDSLRFRGDRIELDGFRIHDPLGNTALADGTMQFAGDEGLRLNIGVKTDNLLVLNKKPSDDFYGTLLASADCLVTGTPTNLAIEVRARTNPGCELTVPISYQQQVKSQNYITFVNDNPTIETEPESERRGAGFGLELNLSITPDVKLNLPMDFSEVTVGVGARGSGDLHVGLGAGSAPQIMGAYEITSGTMKVGLLSVYEKAFTLESGSSMNFQGNVPDARFDLRAVYSQRVNMSTLTGNLSTIDNTQKYLQVENVIAISGTLQDPTIGFDIRLPNADQSVEEEVFAYIDRNSERDMLNQTVSLLLGGSFYNVSSNNNVPGSNPLDIVTSFVGNSLSDMVQFVDVDIAYKSATDMTNEQFDVNISKDWGRWYLESTLGYGGDSRELEADNIGGAIIDALIGYRLSPLVHLFAYNRTNTNDYTRIDMPYKQGAGLKLTKDFDRWADLFKRKNKAKGSK